MLHHRALPHLGSFVPAEAGARAPSASQPAAPTEPPAPAPKPSPKGDKDASFVDSRRHWDGEFDKVIGTATKKLQFGIGFKLTDQHIEDILAIGPKVCASLTEFQFIYADVNYNAHNGAQGLTDASITKLAHRCPKLKKLYLPGTSGLGNEALLSLLEHCPDLTHLEITDSSGYCGSNITAAAFKTFQSNPEWVPKLKKLRLVNQQSKKTFMTAMRALGKQRTTLAIELVTTDESKRYGDWELDVSNWTYKKGSKAGFYCR